MDNGGWFGTEEEWKRIENPLFTVDPFIEAFSKEFEISLSKNLKDWPERSLRWGADIGCLIQIYLADAEKLTWNLWICCHNDRDGKRYLNREFLVEKQEMSEFSEQILELLTIGHERLILWSKHPEKLEFATTLGKG